MRNMLEMFGTARALQVLAVLCLLASATALDVDSPECRGLGTTLDSALLVFPQRDNDWKPWMTANDLDGKNETHKRSLLAEKLESIWQPENAPMDYFEEMASVDLIQTTSLVLFLKNTNNDTQWQNWKTDSLGNLKGKLVDFILAEKEADEKFKNNYKNYFKNLELSSLLSIACDQDWSFGSFTAEPITLKNITILGLPSNESLPTEVILSMTKVGVRSDEPLLFISVLFPSSLWMLSMELSPNGNKYRYVDHLKWSKCTGVMPVAMAEECPHFLRQYDPRTPYPTFEQTALKKTEAVLMNVVPIYLTIDNTTKPDKTDGDTALAAVPIPGGSWENHILIHHKKSDGYFIINGQTYGPFFASMKTDLTLVRVGKNGMFYQILEDFNNKFYYNFHADLPPVVSQASVSFIKARSSYVVYGMKDSVTGYRVRQTTQPIYGKHAISELINANNFETSIDSTNVLDMVLAENMFKLYLVVLENIDDNISKVKVFPWIRASREVYDLNSEAVFEMKFSDVKFLRMKFFKTSLVDYILFISSSKVVVCEITDQGKLIPQQDFLLDEIVDVHPVQTNALLNRHSLVFTQKSGIVVYILDSSQWKKVHNETLDENDALGSTSTITFSNHANVFGLINGNASSLGSLLELKFGGGKLPVINQEILRISDLEAEVINLKFKKIKLNINNRFNRLKEKLNNVMGNHHEVNVIKGDFTINSLKVQETLSMPLSALDNVKHINVNFNGTDEHDIKPVLNIDFADVNKTLHQVANNLDELEKLKDDVLLLDNDGKTQIVTNELQSNYVKAGKVNFKKGENVLKVDKIGGKYSDPLDIHQLKNFYSLNQDQDVTIEGTKTFNEKVTFVDLQTSTIQLEKDNSTQEYSIPNLITYEDSQEFLAMQTFKKGVDIDTLTFSKGALLTNGDIEIDVEKDIVEIQSSLPGFIKFQDKVIVNEIDNDGRVNDLTHSSEFDNILLRDDKNPHIKGKLTIRNSDSNYLLNGTIMELNVKKINDVDIKKIFDNAAWSSCPDQQDFCKDVQFQNPVTIESDVKILKSFQPKYINGYAFEDYIQFPNICNNSVRIGGKKTFEEPVTVGRLSAKKINGIKMGDLVTKSTEQTISSQNKFKKGIGAENILEDENHTLLIDGVDLHKLFTVNFNLHETANEVAEQQNKSRTKYATIVMMPGSSLHVEGDFNGIENLSELIADVVNKTETNITINGKTTFTRPITAGDVTVDDIKTTGDNDLEISYTTDDFMNRNIDQTIRGVKTFQAPISFSDMKMAGPDVTLAGPLAAQVINDWININDMTIKNKLSFDSLETESFELLNDAKLNGYDASKDLALLNGDNEFCEDCTQTFENLEIQNGEVYELSSKLTEYDTPSHILGVNITHLDQTRVKTKGEQTLHGYYHFESLIHEGGQFDAEICAHTGNYTLCLTEFESKFLKTDGDKQTITGKKRIKSLTSSNSLNLQTGKITIVKENRTKVVNIKELFDQTFLLDQPYTINQDFKFNDAVEVVQGFTVQGKTDNVDVSKLAADAIVKGRQEGGNEIKAVITGKKTFDVPPIISKTMFANEEWEGTMRRVLTKSSDQNITAKLTVNGNVKAKNVEINGLFNQVDVSSFDSKLRYDTPNDMYVWTGDLDITDGELRIKDLSSTKVNGRDFTKFAKDTVSTSDLDVTMGSKIFSNVLFKNPIKTNLLNNLDIVQMKEDCADIRYPAVFSKENTFLSQNNALKSLRVTDKLILNNSNIGKDINLNWIKNHYVKSSSSQRQIISGKVVFEENVETAKNVNIESLSDLGEKITMKIPDDLVHLDDAEISLTSPAGVNRKFDGVEILANSSITGQVVGHEFEELTNLLYLEGNQIITGKKTFLGTVEAKDRDTFVDTVNGIKIPSNLVWLHEKNVLYGTYNFENISTADLKLDGLIDGVNFTDMVENLLTTDTEQTITEVYKFNKGATFKEIKEWGDQPLISGMKPKKLKNIQEVYDLLYAAKLSAQAETASLCRKVSEIGSSYLTNYEVKYFERASPVKLMENMEFTAVKHVHAAGKLFILVAGQNQEGCSTVTLFQHTPNHELKEIRKVQLTEHTKPDGMNENEVQSLSVSDIKNTFKICLKHKISSIEAVPLVSEDDHFNHAIIITPNFMHHDAQINGLHIFKLTGPAKDVNGLQLEEVGILANVLSMSNLIKRKHLFVLDHRSLESQKESSSKSLHLRLSSISRNDLLHCHRDKCEIGLRPIWQSHDPSDSGKKFSPKLDAIEYPAQGQIIAAFSDDTTQVSTPVIRLVAMSEDLSEESSFAISKERHDFTLFSRRSEILLATAGRYGISVDKLDMEEKTNVLTQVIYSNQSLINVRRQKDFLGERNVITVLENQGDRDSSVAFYEHMGTMGFQLKRRVQVDIPAKEMSLIEDINQNDVAIQLAVVGKGKIRVLDGVMPDISAIETISNLHNECLDPVVERSFSPYVTNPYCEMNPLHTRCRYVDQSVSCDIKNNWLNETMQQIFLDVHNEQRRKIAQGDVSGQPPAANMKKMRWNEEIAQSAQKWTDQCKDGFDEVRQSIHGEPVGQNIIPFVHVRADFQMDETHISSAIKAWRDQSEHFKKEYINPFKFTDKANEYQMYTQLAWANTDEVGCGWTLYKVPMTPENHDTRYKSFIVCNYIESGNVLQEEMYKVGEPCSRCPDGWQCEAKDGALCVDPNLEYSSIVD